MLCRSIQLLALLARGDGAKDLEILLLTPPTHRPPPPDSTTQAPTRRPGAARRRQPRPSPDLLVLLPRQARDAAALAPAAGQRGVDLSAAWTGASTPRPGGPAAHRPPRQGEPRATSASKENCCASGCGSQHPRSAAPSAVMDWTRPRAGPRRPGGRSCASKLPGSSPATCFTVDTVSGAAPARRAGAGCGRLWGLVARLARCPARALCSLSGSPFALPRSLTSFLFSPFSPPFLFSSPSFLLARRLFSHLSPSSSPTSSLPLLLSPFHLPLFSLFLYLLFLSFFPSLSFSSSSFSSSLSLSPSPFLSSLFSFSLFLFSPSLLFSFLFLFHSSCDGCMCCSS